MFVQRSQPAWQTQTIRQSQRTALPALRQKADDPAALQSRKLLLQSQMLLLKATTQEGASDLSSDLQEKLQSHLEQVDAALRTAQAEGGPKAESESLSLRPALDDFQPEQTQPSPGIYLVKPGPNGYTVSFQPYQEETKLSFLV